MLRVEELNALVEEATQSMPGTVTVETDLARLDGWDSMGLVIFIDSVKGRTEVELAVHELRACSSTEAIRELISRAARA